MNPFLFRLFRDNEVKVPELNYLFWECTTRCNFHCRHCGSDCGIVRSSDDSGSNTTSASQSRQKDMPLEDFLAAIDTIPVQDRARNFCVVLTGGEPLLRPDILEIGRELRSRGLLWGIVSNGWFYDDAMHLKLMDAGMGAVTVSLDCLEASHDWMRGVPGSYKRAVRAIDAFARDPRLNSDVVTCVNRRNLNELPEIYDLLKSKGLKQWRLFTIIPIGRAAHDPDMHLTDKEFITLMEFIKSKREEAKQIQQLHRSQSSQTMNVTFSCEGYLGKYEEKVRDVRFTQASTSPRFSSTAASALAPTSTATASPKAISILTISGKSGTNASSLSATAAGQRRAVAPTASSGATASATACTTGTAPPPRSSSATTPRLWTSISPRNPELDGKQARSWP